MKITIDLPDFNKTPEYEPPKRFKVDENIGTSMNLRAETIEYRVFYVVLDLKRVPSKVLRITSKYNEAIQACHTDYAMGTVQKLFGQPERLRFDMSASDRISASIGNKELYRIEFMEVAI